MQPEWCLGLGVKYCLILASKLCADHKCALLTNEAPLVVVLVGCGGGHPVCVWGGGGGGGRRVLVITPCLLLMEGCVSGPADNPSPQWLGHHSPSDGERRGPVFTVDDEDYFGPPGNRWEGVGSGAPRCT